MRDLGEMGESSLQFWCSQVGLVANGSRIDKTGWDFVIEFPFHKVLGPTRLHESAIECKVQVKATDKQNRKLPIKLSNLRRLITAPMPAFILFLEFDGKKNVQRAFLVHVDAELISTTLQRVHELETGGMTDHHKRTLTVHYGSKHEIKPLDGEGLKSKIELSVPQGMNSYVAWKNKHLKTTGYEKGFAQITFQTGDEANLLELIDVSLGLKRSARVTQFRESQVRFGIKSQPELVSEIGELEMPNLKPTAVGSINFKDDRLSVGLTFACRFYSSPLNAGLPKSLVKFRVEADCFDFILHPHLESGQCQFNPTSNVRLPINQLHDALCLIRMLTSAAKKIDLRLELNDGKPIAFQLNPSDRPFEHAELLDALKAAVEICHYFELNQNPVATLGEIERDVQHILQFWKLIGRSPPTFQCRFSVNSSGPTLEDRIPTAVVFLSNARVGKTVFGAIFVYTGIAQRVTDGEYSYSATTLKIERKIVSSIDEMISKEDLDRAFEEVRQAYVKDYLVFNHFNTPAR